MRVVFQNFLNVLKNVPGTDNGPGTRIGFGGMDIRVRSGPSPQGACRLAP